MTMVVAKNSSREHDQSQVRNRASAARGRSAHSAVGLHCGAAHHPSVSSEQGRAQGTSAWRARPAPDPSTT